MAFLLGFFTSFGWWTAGKVQKQIDGSIVNVKIQLDKEDKNNQ
jgi:hypothetical protein